jgi:hypothetical protein
VIAVYAGLAIMVAACLVGFLDGLPRAWALGSGLAYAFGAGLVIGWLL